VKRRTLVRRLGSLLLALGVLMLVWGVVVWMWGDPATGAYTWWQQRKLAGEYEQTVDRYRPARTSPPASSPAASPTHAPRDLRRLARRFRLESERGDPIGRIRIQRLGLSMLVVNGTDAGPLKRGPGRDLRTFMPGEGELVYIAGHRTTWGAPFAHIDSLRNGDRVVLEMPYGRFVYRVSSSVIVPAEDMRRLLSAGREELALQACHPRFSARERYIVYATPVSARPASKSSVAAGLAP
jgi:sortase A